MTTPNILREGQKLDWVSDNISKITWRVSQDEIESIEIHRSFAGDPWALIRRRGKPDLMIHLMGSVTIALSDGWTEQP